MITRLEATLAGLDKCQLERRADWTRRHAERMYMTPEQVHSFLGMVTVPCDCGAFHCEGWQAVNEEIFELDNAWDVLAAAGDGPEDAL